MTGIDKIIEKINADCERECERVANDAQNRAREIGASAAAECEAITRDALTSAQQNAEETVKRGESAAQQLERQTLLRYRIDAINAVLARAVEELKGMESSEYFIALETLAVNHAQQGKATMYMNEKSLAAMPENFPARLASSLPQGCEISVSAQPRAIDSGFVLVYGDIDINCTFDALANEKRDELKEKICSIIF